VDRSIIALIFSFLIISSVLTGCSETLDVEAAHVFDDVPDDCTWGHAIQVLGCKGYVCGKEENTFDPQATISRAEMAVLLVRAKFGPEYVPEATSNPWCQCWIDKAVAEELMSPVGDPTVPATRADVTTLMWLMGQ